MKNAKIADCLKNPSGNSENKKKITDKVAVRKLIDGLHRK